MNRQTNIEVVRDLICKHIVCKDSLDEIKLALKALEKEFIITEYKLEKTLNDRQVTNNVLNKTIEELQEKTAALNEQKSQLEEQSKFKEELFANVSHELRTPLHGIQGMNQLLSKTNLDNSQREYVEIVKNSANNLLVIINDLLTFSQINAGKIKLKPQPFSLQQLCNELNNILSLEAQKKGLSLLCVCPPSLPEFLIGDQTRLYQLFINLLNNAIKFTHVGYIALHIFVLEKTDHKVDLQFEIRDTGIGMKKDQLNKIFNSFTRVHEDSDTVYEGAGLGLNIVKNIVNIMGGSIEVNSEVNKGTSFFVNLSFEIPTEEEVAVYLKKKTSLQIPKHWAYKNILLIEDNKANLLFAKNMFLDWGIEITTAETIAEAKAKVASEEFDCILSDVKLPDGNGLAFIKELRGLSGQQNQHSPVIVLTASSNEKEAHYAKSIDVQSYIGKPFSPELLVQELSKVLDEPLKKNKDTSPRPSGSIPQNQHAYFMTLNRNFPNKNQFKLEILDIFLDQIPNTLNTMEESINLNDLETFYFEAHSIKSTINNIGLPKLQPLIHKMNEYSHKKINTDQIPDLFESFKKTAMADIQILLKERERLKEPV